MKSDAVERYAVYEVLHRKIAGNHPALLTELEHAVKAIPASPLLAAAMQLPEIKALVEKAFSEGFDEGNRDVWYSAKSAWQQSAALAALQKGGAA
jgi:hypothetical protein